MSQSNSAPAIEIIEAWREHLELAYKQGYFPLYDIDSAKHHLANFSHSKDDLLGQFFRAIKENKPHLAADLAQKIILSEAVPS